MLRYEFIQDDGNIGVIETPGLFIPDMKIRLFSPQRYFQWQHAEPGHQPGELVISYNKAVISLTNSKVTIPYDRVTRLPILQVFHSATDEHNHLHCPVSLMSEIRTSLGCRK